MAHLYWRGLLDLAWLGFLLFMLWHFWRARSNLAQAKNWLKTKGQIISCEWVTEGRVLWPKIEYIYQVNEQDIMGEYLFLDTAHNTPSSRYSRQIAYEVALAFKENRDVDVYYNPNDPKQAALDISIPKKLNVILILLVIALVGHLGFMSLRLL